MRDPLDIAAAAYESMHRHGDALARLRRTTTADIEPALDAACGAFAAVQDRVLGLSCVYVSLLRLHGAASRADVLAALQEIVVNIVGSEELVVYERRAGALEPVHAFGSAPPAAAIALGDGPIGGAAASGVAWLRDPPAPADAPEGTLSACIPLKHGAEVVGALAYYRMLPHKPRLGERDLAVLDLLEAQGGAALRLAALRERG
jgi:hypothetical protein